jgi:hypothetical protein
LHVSIDEETTEAGTAAPTPNLQCISEPPKLLPDTVTTVPPLVEPDVGDTLEIIGAET